MLTGLFFTLVFFAATQGELFRLSNLAFPIGSLLTRIRLPASQTSPSTVRPFFAILLPSETDLRFPLCRLGSHASLQGQSLLRFHRANHRTQQWLLPLLHRFPRLQLGRVLVRLSLFFLLLLHETKFSPFTATSISARHPSSTLSLL